MKKEDVPQLYEKYFIDKTDERRNMFQQLNDIFKPDSGMYPGSFVHIAPSFYIPDMTYVDSDSRLNKFFADKTVMEFINKQKIYREEPKISWFQEDFSEQLPIEENRFDILFSFYAGFISQHCKKYLKKNGVLVCNNSHGDASIAYGDHDYSFMGVILRNGNDFRIVTDGLEHYFQKKDGSNIDTDKVLKRMIGEKFSKTGYAYIFRKTSL